MINLQLDVDWDSLRKILKYGSKEKSKIQP